VSDPKADKKDKAPQMKIIIGMVQNSYRLINELMSKIDGLTSKIDQLSSAMSSLANPDFENTQMGKRFNTLTQLLLASTAYNLNENLTAPPPQAIPFVFQSNPSATSSQPLQTAPSWQSAPLEQPQEGQSTPAVQGNDPSLLKPSKLFKKLNQ